MNDIGKPRVLLTGAAGKIGRRVRPFLRNHYKLRLTDLNAIDDLADNEEFQQCDLADPAATASVVRGMSAIVHLAGIPREADIQSIASANLVATYNVFAAAKDHDVRRVVFGSTNHVVGFYPAGQVIDASAAVRPDTLYGASKVFGEAVARLFYDKHGVESVSIRIGSALDKPTNVRQLSTWISYEDLARLIWRSIVAPRVEAKIVYGLSGGSRHWWQDNGPADLGYEPQDSADDYVEAILGMEKEFDHLDIAQVFQGGPWAADGYSKP